MMLSWSVPVAEQMIENKDYKVWITSEMFGWLPGIFAIGGTLSSLISGYVRSTLGTRMTIIIASIPIIIGHLLIIFASSFGMVKSILQYFHNLIKFLLVDDWKVFSWHIRWLL